jgi:hypothetical protein
MLDSRGGIGFFWTAPVFFMMLFLSEMKSSPDYSMKINILLRTEESQACARAVIVSLIAVFIGTYLALYETNDEVLRILISAIIYSPLSILWWLYVRFHPMPSEVAQVRILIGVVFDSALISWCISISNSGHPILYLLYLLYLWVIMGNGMRFGRHTMTYATLVCVMSLCLVAVLSPAWPLPVPATLVLVAGLLMVDMFCRQLLKLIDDQAREILHLSHDLRSAHLGVSETGLLEMRAFVDSVQEAMASLPEGNILAAVVIAYAGPGAERIGNPMSSITKALAARINSELRGGDLATLGREDELWMCIEPKRMSDAAAVAERVRRAFQEIVPHVVVRIGLANYPNISTDAHGLFNAASRHARQSNGKHTRLGHLTVIESDT